MPRVPLVPEQLPRRPFTIEEAHRAGLDRWHLQGSSWRRLGPKVYAWAGLGDGPIVRLAAAALRLPAGAVFCGLTAAWLHGLDVEPCDPIDVAIPTNAGVSGRAGLRLRRISIANRDVATKQELRATTVERTLADLCLDLDLTEIVVLADAALHRRMTSIKNLAAAADHYSGRPGVATLRRVIQLTEPAAESHMETRLRMLLVLSGLPRPIAQMSLHDRWGRFLGRPDLYYPDEKLGLAYDGGTHRTNLVDDNRRQNRIQAEHITLLRFTAGDIYNHPDSVVDQVRGRLARAAA